MLEVRRSRDRGYTDNGWLKTFHSFAFADYFDPEHVEFGPLRVINEDRLKPGKGLAPSSQQDMEILTFVLSGKLARKDSLGNNAVLKAGDVQRISTGTGVEHSETNPSAAEELHLLQIWIRSAKPGLAPTSETKHFDVTARRGALQQVASPDGESGSVKIRQDARIYVTRLTGPEAVGFEVGRNRCAYVHVARGSVAANDTRLNCGDAMKITQAARITLHNGSDAEVIVLNLPASQLNVAFERPRSDPSHVEAPVAKKAAAPRAPKAVKAVKAKASASSAGSGRRAGRRKATSGK